jgi:hypothetical protein
MDRWRDDIYKSRAKTFFDRSQLFAEQENDIQKARMHSKSRKKATEMLPTNAEATPCVALMNGTV